MEECSPNMRRITVILMEWALFAWCIALLLKPDALSDHELVIAVTESG